VNTEIAARTLLEARKKYSRIDGIPEDCRPRTVDEGYAVQDALVALSGAKVVGWKLGATTPYWQKRAGLIEPMGGRLLDSDVHRGNTRLEGAHFHMRMVESEYGFVLGRDLPPREEPYSRAEVEAAVSAVHGCLEVADTRYSSGLKMDTPSLIADNVLAGAYLIGPEIGREIDLQNEPVKVWVDGALINEGKGEHTGGHPILPLVWLANDRRKRGDGLKSGMLISTGSTTGAYRSGPQAKIRADYGRFGSIELTFV
jgi:2-keto-4-pentenoate hydratase